MNNVAPFKCYVLRRTGKQHPFSSLDFLYSRITGIKPFAHINSGQNKTPILKTRPSKRDKYPPPFYLTASSSKLIYCHTCGRIITSRKCHISTSAPVKYCSDRCRRCKPGPIDRQIEDAFISLLQGNKEIYIEKYDVKEESKNEIDIEIGLKKSGKRHQKKGEHRTIVWCSEIQALVFGHQFNQTKRKNSEFSVTQIDMENWKSDEMENKNIEPNPIRDDLSEVEKSEQGRQRAKEREMVRRAARRGVVFGFTIKNETARTHEKGKKFTKAKRDTGICDKSKNDEGVTRDESEEIVGMCEAVMTSDAIVVEPSFAKGDWGIRWREGNFTQKD
ncbi:hypothetical protein OnM2_095030 [Erysiphe neolycopersici]|uniref:Uncharacterized protein n=1 Tax=Erysiphe neolycopersici TaxID=212602 RepID=A0A420HB93_9PEZI|nr:hypothetical protein OnM2_095030 [Erysiphe neolycopersici]